MIIVLSMRRSYKPLVRIAGAYSGITALLLHADCDEILKSKSNDSILEECANPACMDKHSKLMRSFADLNLDQKYPKHDSVRLHCPLDREALGKSAWNLIHTMAANFPENPSEEEKIMAVQFAHAISRLFPCKVCAKDFEKKLKSSPLM